MDCIPSTSVGFFAIPMQENLTQPVSSSETVLIIQHFILRFNQISLRVADTAVN